MTLDEAIQEEVRLEYLSGFSGNACYHRQLCIWLMELKERREKERQFIFENK